MAEDNRDVFEDLNDRQLDDLIVDAARLSGSRREAGEMELADKYHEVAVAGAEEQDRRRHAIEAARYAVDGDDAGELWDGSPPSLH